MSTPVHSPPTKMVKPYSLPQELTDKIVDALFNANDQESIRACSQVSRAFYYRSRYYIFREVYLACHHDAESLYDLCINSPDLCSCVESLIFTKIWDMDANKFLLPLIKLLTKVTFIRISGLLWGWFPDDVLDASASLPLLTGSSLKNVYFNRGMRSFYSFASRLRNLVAVTFEGGLISLREESLEVVFREAKPVAIKKIHIYSSPQSQVFIEGLFTSPASPFCLRELQDVTFDVDPNTLVAPELLPSSGDHDFTLLKRIVDESRESLMTLEIVSVNFIPPFDICLCHISDLRFIICEHPSQESVPISAIKWLIRGLVLPSHMKSARLSIAAMVIVGRESLWIQTTEGSECFKCLDSILVDSRYPLQKFLVEFSELNEDQKDARKLAVIQNMPQLHKKGLLDIRLG
ncbi:uncharacterized protein EV420DRAFT_1771826 [Desarmillaria tabescens]|uniref:F-box domain-containing protein n=1 Tax=Armillaria tabescens TaxID=1929756 RepID=A0AA39MFD8_ARMTA|nr:uncharacterized protein EV420DRAFT_1771826 [Desarmillaria tabescens]KAK0432826.1 hypothetical protein EV420DRAFT_1771826 [Desarmillaria tabescens]